MSKKLQLTKKKKKKQLLRIVSIIGKIMVIIMANKPFYIFDLPGLNEQRT